MSNIYGQHAEFNDHRVTRNANDGEPRPSKDFNDASDTDASSLQTREFCPTDLHGHVGAGCRTTDQLPRVQVVEIVEEPKGPRENPNHVLGLSHEMGLHCSMGGE